MYVYDEDRTSGTSPGIGRLDAFGKSQKKTAQELAEAQRLEAEMTKLDAKHFWSGVDRTYKEWLKVRDETNPTKWRIHQIAADAAMQLGDAGTRYQRLWTALALLKRDTGPLEKHDLEKRDLMNGQIWRLGNYWVQVDIHLARGSERSLVPKSIAATDGAIQALALAKKKLADEGKFNNLLPLGNFIISGQEIFLKDEWAWSRVWAVHLNQEKDGSFSVQLDPRRPTSEVHPPLHVR